MKQRSLTGKIAVLPYHIREQLNRRLLNGQTGPRLLPWLNNLPAVKKIITDEFAGKPVSSQNLAYWRADGYQRWLKERQILEPFRKCGRDAKKFTRAARSLAAGAAAVASLKIFEALHPDSGQNLSLEQIVKLLPAINSLRKADQQDVRLKYEKTRLQQRNEQLYLTRDRDQRDDAAIGLRLLHDERAKFIESTPCDNFLKLELIGRHMFGDLWAPRLIPPSPMIKLPDQPPNPQPPTPSHSHDSCSSSFSKNEDIARPQEPLSATKSYQAPPSDSTDKNPISQSPQPTPDSLANPHKTTPNDPSEITPLSTPDQGESSTGTSDGESNSLSQRERAGVRESHSKENAASNAGAPDPQPAPRSLAGEAEFPDLLPPQITPGKTTQRLIAEIEEYSALLNARKRDLSSRRSRGDEALIDSSSSHAAPEPLGEGGSSSKNVVPSVPSPASAAVAPASTENVGGPAASSLSQRERAGVRENHPDENAAPGQGDLPSPHSALRNPQSEISQLPALPEPLGEGRSTHHTLNPSLSPYERALLEGKSHLEALYAQFTPTPEEFARRKRANEELRRASDPSFSQLHAAPELLSEGGSTPPPLNYQPYGPCPAPHSWQGHRPLDPWKVHTG